MSQTAYHCTQIVYWCHSCLGLLLSVYYVVWDTALCVLSWNVQP